MAYEIFFVSSVGDTDLAKATIKRLIEQNILDLAFVIPLTTTAEKQTEDLREMKQVNRVSLSEITEQADILSKKRIENSALEKITAFVKDKGIHRAYIGVPSPLDEEVPYQIANRLNIPCVIAYEFMFKPNNHPFWKHAHELTLKDNCEFAVSLKPASQDLLQINPKAHVHEIGHLSIDRSLLAQSIDTKAIRASLAVNENEELVFVSGTTQPIEMDNQFLKALLAEMATGEYPHHQIRFGIHPGRKDMEAYLDTLLATCKEYPGVEKQVKLILSEQIAKELHHPFILRSKVSGSEAAQTANRVAQAVPGALLNEAALRGKPSYFHEQAIQPYLPANWFASGIPLFLAAKPVPAREHKDLGLQDTATNLCAKLMVK